jgi:hypothetical protein
MSEAVENLLSPASVECLFEDLLSLRERNKVRGWNCSALPSFCAEYLALEPELDSRLAHSQRRASGKIRWTR